MRFVHIADTHLGLSAFHATDPGTGMNLREKLIYDNFLAAIDRIIAVRPDALVHAGDLFDRVKPKTRAYTTVLDALERLRDSGIPFLVISGNHSMPKTRYTTSPFTVLQYHSADIYAAFRYRYERVELGDTVFHLIPNMLRPEHYREAYEEVSLAPGHANVLVTHGLSSTIADRRLNTVAEHELDSTILDPDFDYIALGHFHDQRRVSENAWYSGSLEYCSYGEMNDTKGGLIVDTGSGEVDHLDLPHTPMIDLGAVDCDGRPPSSVTGEIIAHVAGAGIIREPAMCQLTLQGLSEESARGLDRGRINEAKVGLLDLRLRIVRPDEAAFVYEGGDLKTIDYLGEFEKFLAMQHLDRKVQSYVASKGLDTLRTVIARQQSEEDAAQ